MKALVTGGGGFLGSAIVKQLVERGDTVRVLARGDYPALREMGAETIRGDLRNAEDVRQACAGMDIVFHVAAKAGVWGKKEDFEGINIQGTQHIIDGCKAEGIAYLVYTSSPSVVHTGKDLEGVGEEVPYGTHFTADYPRTKAEAERLALAANGSDLKVVALRPHLIWGPGDPHILPRLEKQAHAGRLRQIGNQNPLVDTVYVDNAAEAHILAADKLKAGANIDGKVYFITNGEPMGCWTIVNRLLEAVEAPPVTRRVPIWFAYAAGRMMEWVFHILSLKGEPPLTRFAVTELATAHYFDISAARNDLGYDPKISFEEGIKRLAAAHQAAKTS